MLIFFSRKIGLDEAYLLEILSSSLFSVLFVNVENEALNYG